MYIAATMELNEVTPQYPPSHHPVVTPKSERLSVTPSLCICVCLCIM